MADLSDLCKGILCPQITQRICCNSFLCYQHHYKRDLKIWINENNFYYKSYFECPYCLKTYSTSCPCGNCNVNAYLDIEHNCDFCNNNNKSNKCYIL